MSPVDLYILGLDVEFVDVVESNGARSAHRREMLGNIKNSECGSVCWARHAFFLVAKCVHDLCSLACSRLYLPKTPYTALVSCPYAVKTYTKA